MARIEISSVSNPYGTGELQLQGKVAMSGTLTAVTDNLNNASPLKLSTGGVQVASTLQITTNSNPYIDAEDGAGNNRFTVGRDPSSQVVNVDFASNPTGGTNMVGAIRTYTDGVNLAEVMSFRKDGYINAKGQVQVGTDGQDGVLIFPTTTSGFATSIYTTYVNNRLTMQCGGGTLVQLSSYVDLISAGNSLRVDGGTHTTTLNTINIPRFVNTGALGVNTTYFVNTNVGVNETSPTAKLQIKGSGSTSATTSLLVQNSVGSTSFIVKDNLMASVGDAFGSGDGIRFEAGNNSSIVFTQASDRIRLQRENSDRLRIDARGTSLYIGEGISTDANVNTWLFEGINNTPVAFDNTRYVKIYINGVAYKLAVCI